IFTGNIVHPGSTTFGINRAGYTLHSAIHKARPDLNCVIHLHTPAVASISAISGDILPLSQEALSCGKISYHDYRGILIEGDVKSLLAKDLGPTNKVMILRNHGFVACGETIEEAWQYAFIVIRASEIQVCTTSVAIDQLYLSSGEQHQRVANILQDYTNDTSDDLKYKTNEIEFECLIRNLDNAGYRTGYHYQKPLLDTGNMKTAITAVEPMSSAEATL
ncbi:unnamed protein product, partial [Rotaria sp. Silwood2]